jgi:hypothetical protein
LVPDELTLREVWQNAAPTIQRLRRSSPHRILLENRPVLPSSSDEMLSRRVGAETPFTAVVGDRAAVATSIRHALPIDVLSIVLHFYCP